MKIVKRYLNDVILLQAERHVVVGENGIIRIDNNVLSSFGILTPFVQENHSRSFANVLRGLHYQINRPQGKIMRVTAGSLCDVFVDLRRSSPNFGRHASVNMQAKDDLLLWVPPGYAHGFFVTESFADVIYQVTDYRFVEYERTLRWDDEALAINWSLNGCQPILSEKDSRGSDFNCCETYN